MEVVIIISFLVIFTIQINYLRKKAMWKEAVIYSVLMLIGGIYSLGIIYNWSLPTITRLTTAVFEPAANIIDNNSEE